MGSPPGPVAGGAPRVWRASPHIAYVTPSRLATRTASSNSPSACACHLDVPSPSREDTCRTFSELFIIVWATTQAKLEGFRSAAEYLHLAQLHLH